MITKTAKRIMMEDIPTDPVEFSKMMEDKDTTIVFDNGKTKAALEQDKKGLNALMKKVDTPPPTLGEVKVKGSGKWGVPLGIAAAVGVPIGAGIYAYRNILRRNKKNK